MNDPALIFNIIGIHKRKNLYLAFPNPLSYLENGKYQQTRNYDN
jgi:hypothetical protein